MLFKGKEGLSFVVTTESSNIDVLKETAEKYGVHIPNVRFIFICYDDAIEMYYELESYGRIEWAVRYPWSELNKANNLPEDSRDLESASYHLMPIIAANLNELHWGNILTGYLAEEGIDYEEQ